MKFYRIAVDSVARTDSITVTGGRTQRARPTRYLIVGSIPTSWMKAFLHPNLMDGRILNLKVRSIPVIMSNS